MSITPTNLIHDLNHNLQSLFSMIDQLNSMTQQESFQDIKTFIAQTKQNADKVRARLASALSNTVSNTDLVSLTDTIRTQCAEQFQIPIGFQYSGFPQALLNKGRYQTLVSNLIRNSVEAGSQKVHIEIDDKKICFRDNGPGFREGVLARIHKKIPITGKLQGVGRGLNLLHEFCKEQKWRVKIGNRPEQNGVLIQILLLDVGRFASTRKT